MTQYLSFVKDVTDTLLRRQTVRAGGRPEGTQCVTVSQSIGGAWTSLGRWAGDHYDLYDIPAGSMEMEPYRLDFAIWPVLNALSEATGDPRYRQIVRGMAGLLPQHGFHPRSGLMLFGAMTEFDMRTLGTSATASFSNHPPYFKPTGGLPWNEFWEVAPQQMQRCFRAAYYGLVTRPDTFNLNRFCTYDFDDSARQHVTRFEPGQINFLSTSVWLIHWWAMSLARANEREGLSWIIRLLDKWRAVQHRDTGLLPHFFGATEINDPEQSPRSYCHLNDAACGLSMLDAADELRRKGEGADAARQLQSMALALMRGIAREAYDPKERLCYSWIRLKGGPEPINPFYSFRTQADKDEALKRDPRPQLEKVSVYGGNRFYNAEPWSVTVGCALPLDLARAAKRTSDAELLQWAKFYTDRALEAGEAIRSAKVDGDKWTFVADATYLEAAILLAELTNDADYLTKARRLADRQIGWLRATNGPEWWRVPGRDRMLAALLALDKAMQG